MAKSKRNFERLANPRAVRARDSESILNHPPQGAAIRRLVLVVDLGIALGFECTKDFVCAEILRDRDRESDDSALDGFRVLGWECLAVRQQLLGGALGGVLADHRRASPAMQGGGAGEQQFQMIINLRHRAHGRARRAYGIGLVDRNSRRDALDAVDLGLVHAVQKLARIGREGFDVAALPLGVERVEDERRFT